MFLSNTALLIYGLCLVFVLVIYNWRRRWLYYCSYKLPGPFSLPLIGSVAFLFVQPSELFQLWNRFTLKYPLKWRVWLANHLYVSTSKAEEIDYILHNCLEKNDIEIYQYVEEFFSSILGSKLTTWKRNRKILNPCFNSLVSKSYFSTFTINAAKLNTVLEPKCGTKFEIFPIIWDSTLGLMLEIFGNNDIKVIGTDKDKMLSMMLSIEKIVTHRFTNPLYYFDFFWKMSPIYKQARSIEYEGKLELKKIIESALKSKDERKNFIKQMFAENLTMKEIEEECAIFITASTETSAIAISSVLLILSMYPNIQDNILQEQITILGDCDAEIVAEDLNRMEYLERVIKETLRLFPAVGAIIRYIDKTIEIDSQLYPERSRAIINIWGVHRNPEYWPDPLRFDPDRFLPHCVQSRPRCSYLPFSAGSRNCIGLNFGMPNVKLYISSILRKFEVLPGKYKSIDEIELEMDIVIKPKIPIKIALKKRH